MRSLLVPGWGQWYNGKKWKAALAFGTECAFAGQAIVQNQRLQRASDPAAREYYLSSRNAANWLLALVVLLSMLDAYVDAHFSDFDESPDLALASRSWSWADASSSWAPCLRLSVKF